jgi:hypothetical protein
MVTLTGAGQGESIIDGEGAMALSFRPVQEGQSLVLLGDGSTVSGFTITHSGGNGVSNQPGARVLILRNEIRQHGQHGLLLSGPHEAMVTDNVFLDNGTAQFRPATPRPAAGRQGHHIFVQGKSGGANAIVITGNTMRRAFADAMALVVFFDEADGVTMQVRMLNNILEQSERRGLTIAGSFGPCHNRIAIDIRHNVIRDNAAQAIAAQAARPLVTQLIRGTWLRLSILDNECRHNQEGIFLCGGFGPAEENLLDATLVNNLISGTARHAVRCIGGVGFGGYGVQRNRVRLTMSGNRLENAGDIPMLLQGSAAEKQEESIGNTVLLQALSHEVTAPPGIVPCVVNDGLPSNAVHLLDSSFPHERVAQALPYQA